MWSSPILISLLASSPLLAAGKKAYSRTGYRSASSQPEVDFVGLLLVVAAMAALGLAAWGFTYWQKRRETRILNSPRALFRELCAAHELNRADRDLLHEIAQWHEIEDSVQLFIEPRRFQSAAMHQDLDCEAEALELHSRLFIDEDTTADNEQTVPA